jgi:hypothetical protein
MEYYLAIKRNKVLIHIETRKNLKCIVPNESNRANQHQIFFFHTTQNSAQFKSYELFISGIFPLKFFDHSWLWVTETSECKIMDKR